MRTLTATLEAAQQAMGIALIKVVLTKSGQVTQTYTNEDRILDVKHNENEDSQVTDVLVDNSDGALTSLDLRGYDAVVSRGYRTSAGDEYSENPSQKVISQDLYSAGGVLTCTLKLVGIPNLLEADKASDDYSHPETSAKTVKGMLSEVADGTAVTENLVVQQASADTDNDLRLTCHGRGQKITFRKRTITKLAFSLKKTGSPTGNITFYIRSSLDLTVLNYKTYAASSLTTAYQWIEVTFDTPVEIDDEVYMYPEYTAGSGANYVIQQTQSSDVKANECLIWLDPFAGFVESPAYDCAYKYTYTGPGIGVFSHCTAYTVSYDPHGTHTGSTHATIMTDSAATFKTDALIGQVIYNTTDGSSGTITDNAGTTVTVAALAGGTDNDWDTNDAYIILDTLIDVYTPKDAFYIKQGESRLSVINRLLAYTGEVKRVENDEKIHIFTPTTSGESYDYEYALASGHGFYRKTSQKALIIPNKITVESFPDDANQYTGNATDATSYALLPVEDFIQMKLTSNAQGTSIASAKIGQLQRASQQGQTSVPMNVGAEIHDYVLVTDTRQNDTRTGNIGAIYWHYKPATFEMEFVFGKLTSIPVPGTRLSLLADIQKQVEQAQQVRGGEITQIWVFVRSSLDIIADGADTNFRLVAERLDNLDRFAEDAQKFLNWLQSNLVIAPDEENFTVNALIEKLYDVTWSEPTRALDTVYQNTSGKIKLVVISCLPASQALIGYIGVTSTPATFVAVDGPGSGDYSCISFIVPVDWYYEAISTSATNLDWHEWDLH